MRGTRLFAALVGAVCAAALAACQASQVGPTSSASSGGASPSASSGGATAPTRPSVTKPDYTPQFAAGVLKQYLGALVAKDATAICALDARTAPSNPDRITSAACVDLQEGRLSGKDWTNVEVDCWASAKDLEACRGMEPLAAGAKPNELGNFVFDSTRGGFSFTTGIPEGCDAKNTTGCWFVVVRGADGDVSVAPHWGERVYR